MIRRESGIWITCTSGSEAVTVGPLLTHLVGGAFAQTDDADGGMGEPSDHLASLDFRTE